jgi:8-oxo-dGTP pyrophosphatase MutT (NUDIX family)
VVVRDGDDGLELFCVERSRRSGFMAGAVVFPGGKVDAADERADWAEQASPPGARARQFVPSPEHSLAFGVAALRETLEEAAILPVVGDLLDGPATLALREALGQSPSQLRTLLSTRGLTLDVARLEALARWITPTAEPKRFDTRFYLLPCPPGQEGAHDRHETTHSFWATPREILARWERGEIFLAPPTSCTIELFVRAGTVASAVEIARRQPLHPICPEFIRDAGEMILTLPGDPLHPTRAQTPLPPSAPTRFVLRDGRFIPTRADAPQSPSR